MKKFITLIITIFLLIALVSCEAGDNIATATPDYSDPDNPVYGLTIGENGTMLLNGEPVYAYGVNLFDVFVNKKIFDRNFDLDTPFKSLHDSGIKVARICMGPFYSNVFAMYINSPDAYFEALDAVVAAAEKYEVGIFASLMWNFTILTDWSGEHVSYALGNENSETIKLAKKYYTDIVNRYKDSPAIWAWEFGNEYNLGADLKSMQNVVGTSLPGIVRTEEDFFTSYDVSNFYTIIGDVIRENDPYRLIVGGDSELSTRPAALRNKNSWEEDGYDDILESTALYAPSSLGAISSHFYHSNHKGQALPDYSDDEEDQIYDKWVKWDKDAAAELEKGLYIGEYGPGEALNSGNGSDELWSQCITHLHQSFLRNDIQIALGWVCVNDFTTPDKLTGFYKSWYDELVQINADFKAEGKQDNIEEYWENAKASLNFDEIKNNCADCFIGLGNPAVALELTSSETNYSNHWLASNYSTNADVIVSESVLADGNSGKVFRLTNNDTSGKTMVKFSYISCVNTEETYKLSFYIKTTDISGDGVKIRLGSPTFLEESGIKSESNGEWTFIELTCTSPSIKKAHYNFSLTFEGQSGTVEIYGIKLTKA